MTTNIKLDPGIRYVTVLQKATQKSYAEQEGIIKISIK